ncbi:hypothetical protein C9Y97_25800 [Escherichia coli]|nr:hypothetical protein C9Y97_25800 [Escherichia coli]
MTPRCGPFRWGPVYQLTGQLSGGSTLKFLPAFGQKVLRDVHFTPGLMERVMVTSAPRKVLCGDAGHGMTG